MGNPRMSTKYKPRLESKLHEYVRNTVEAVMRQGGHGGMTGFSIEVPFGATIEWEEKPSFSNLHWTKIAFYGQTRWEQAFAHYEGEYGVWEIDLALWSGPPSEEVARRRPCIRTWGKARCMKTSEEWRETIEQRRTRLRQWIAEGIL